VYTTFEGNDFVIDNLYPGSILNHRSFIHEDLMQVCVRSKTNVIVQKLSIDKLNELSFMFKGFKRRY